jgi:hypothetical protein
VLMSLILEGELDEFIYALRTRHLENTNGASGGSGQLASGFLI